MARPADTSARDEPRHEQRHALRHQQHHEVTSTIPDGTEKCQLTAALEHISEQHGRETDSAEEQAQAAKGLKRGQVRVLDLVERREPGPSCC